MKYIELILLVVAYSTLILTIFFSLICFKRKIENWETIAFEVSLLLLIVSMTISPLLGLPDGGTTNVFTLASMIVVALMTPLDVMAERKHRLPQFTKKVIYLIALVLSISLALGYFISELALLENVIVLFLGTSVVLSMFLIRSTKPEDHVAHLEKSSRIFSVIFMVLVPFSLFASYVLSDMGYDLKIGFTLPVVFILLAINKLLDDLQRLSLINQEIQPLEQHFKNFLLSEREKEIAGLLIKGLSYKQMANELHISMPTVKTHASNIYNKCNVKTRHELTALLSN